MLIGASADIAAAEVEIENTSRVEMPTLVSTAGRTLIDTKPCLTAQSTHVAENARLNCLPIDWT
jgi:hypothetical protein